MPKRRSTTRLPRQQRPRDTERSVPVTIDPGLQPRFDHLARVVLAPVIMEERIFRVVEPAHSTMYVEEWQGDYWLPSDVALHVVRVAPFATEDELRERRLPAVFWGASSQVRETRSEE
jgi:hypothetical protein